MKKQKVRSLRQFREKHGLSQQRVAEEIGVDDTTIYRIEAGIVTPRRLTQRAIDQFMDDHEAAARLPAS
jgi:DNA-binding XRE family transcriptional regulator